jgi:hypothetical protein
MLLTVLKVTTLLAVPNLALKLQPESELLVPGILLQNKLVKAKAVPELEPKEIKEFSAKP